VIGVELRLLGQIANLDPRLRARFAFKIGINPGHDLEHGGLARAIKAQQADLRAGEE